MHIHERGGVVHGQQIVGVVELRQRFKILLRLGLNRGLSLSSIGWQYSPK